jgi:hypothetical protein
MCARAMVGMGFAGNLQPQIYVDIRGMVRVGVAVLARYGAVCQGIFLQPQIYVDIRGMVRVGGVAVLARYGAVCQGIFVWCGARFLLTWRCGPMHTVCMVSCCAYRMTDAIDTGYTSG